LPLQTRSVCGGANRSGKCEKRPLNATLYLRSVNTFVLNKGILHPMHTTKCCTKCLELKELAQFSIDPRNDGRVSHCRTCRSTKTKLWQAANPRRRGKRISKPRGSQARGFPPNVLLDPEDHARFVHLSWHISSTGYARTQGVDADDNYVTIYLHRKIMDCPEGLAVDHKNGIKLDCRKANLRLVTSRMNSQNIKMLTANKSGHMGVHWDKHRQKWVASARKADGKKVVISTHDTIKPAAKAAIDYRLANYAGYLGRHLKQLPSPAVRRKIANPGLCFDVKSEIFLLPA
jgi:hypothetical protein